MATYVLPDLPYDFGALEPHVSGKIMELHHGKHHATYVKKANETLDALNDARSKADFTRIAGLEKALAFNLSGHVLHSLFWQNLKPKADPKPTGELAEAFDRDFGSFDNFRAQMTAAAGTIMGSGWAALVWEPMGKRLLTTQIYDHQSNLAQGSMPIMVIDAWEHAYYLQYQNQKEKFFEAIWSCFNWQDIAIRFDNARKIDSKLQGASTNGAGKVQQQPQAKAGRAP